MSARERLPEVRRAITRKFSIEYVDELDDKIRRRLKFYVTAGMYDDGRLGEIFVAGVEDRQTRPEPTIEAAQKIGSLMSGTLDVQAIMISLALQHGTPLETITSKLRGLRFGPAGWTGDPAFPNCSSMFDLIAQWLNATFPDGRVKSVCRCDCQARCASCAAGSCMSCERRTL